MKQLIKDSIAADVPLFILGESGWGKSSMVAEVATELGLPLIDLRGAALLPEDVAGIPKVENGYYEYLPPKWVHEFKDKEFILFLDEINQSSVQVLHALYKVVLDRTVADVRMPKMKVIAAGNLSSENAFLTDMPAPLKNRFLIHTIEKNATLACEFLNNKYKLQLTDIFTNPRATEMAIKMWNISKNEEAVRSLGGEQLLAALNHKSKTNGAKVMAEVELVKTLLHNNLPIPSHISAESIEAAKEAWADEKAAGVAGTAKKKK